MKMIFPVNIVATILLAAPLWAAEMDHAAMDHSTMHHGNMQPANKPAAGAVPLEPLAAMPASGKAREGGYDGRYVMEATDVADSLALRCAQASRGLIMLDNASWSHCAARPSGAARGPSSSQPAAAMPGPEGHGGHEGHAM
jgi:hypothetical protein